MEELALEEERIKDNIIQKQKSEVTSDNIKVNKFTFFKPREILIKDYDPKLPKKTFEIYFTRKELFQLAKLVYNTVHCVIPPYKKLNDYFIETINIMNRLDRPIEWVTPAGMNVVMSNKLTLDDPKQIKTNILRKASPISITVPTGFLNHEQIKTGFMPNFIHSLDASNIHILIKHILTLKLEQTNLYTIHDCFASDYKTIAFIELLVKKSFSDMYFNENYLQIIHKNFLNQINTAIGGNIKHDPIKNKYFALLPPKLSNIIKLADFKKNKNKKPTPPQLVNTSSLEKVYLPELPVDLNWEMDKDKFRNNILFNIYFIS